MQSGEKVLVETFLSKASQTLDSKQEIGNDSWHEFFRWIYKVRQACWKKEARPVYSTFLGPQAPDSCLEIWEGAKCWKYPPIIKTEARQLCKTSPDKNCLAGIPGWVRGGDKINLHWISPDKRTTQNSAHCKNFTSDLISETSRNIRNVQVGQTI